MGSTKAAALASQLYTGALSLATYIVCISFHHQHTRCDCVSAQCMCRCSTRNRAWPELSLTYDFVCFFVFCWVVPSCARSHAQARRVAHHILLYTAMAKVSWGCALSQTVACNVMLCRCIDSCRQNLCTALRSLTSSGTWDQLARCCCTGCISTVLLSYQQPLSAAEHCSRLCNHYTSQKSLAGHSFACTAHFSASPV